MGAFALCKVVCVSAQPIAVNRPIAGSPGTIVKRSPHNGAVVPDTAAAIAPSFDAAPQLFDIRTAYFGVMRPLVAAIAQHGRSPHDTIAATAQPFPASMEFFVVIG